MLHLVDNAQLYSSMHCSAAAAGVTMSCLSRTALQRPRVSVKCTEVQQSDPVLQYRHLACHVHRSTAQHEGQKVRAGALRVLARGLDKNRDGLTTVVAGPNGLFGDCGFTCS
jgi:hypothetical protein